MILIENKNKVAIKIGDKEISYKEVLQNIKQFSSIDKIEKNSHVIIFMSNRVEFVYSFYHVWDCNAVNVSIDFSASPKDLAYYIENSDAVKIITENKGLDTVKQALDILDKKIDIVNVDEISFGNFSYSGELKIENKDLDSTAVILYTSGTTGKPKGVMITYENIKCNVEGLDTYKMFEEKDTFIVLLPLHHILPLAGTVVVPLMLGSIIVFLDDFTAQAMLATMQKHKVTIMIGVPKIWEVMHKKIIDTINSKKITKMIFKLAKKLNIKFLNHILFKKIRDTFGGNIKFLVSGGSKINGDITADFLIWGIKICDGYGMTETAPLISYTPHNRIVPGSIGEVLKNIDVKISDDGEILVKGRNVMKGYYKNEEATKEIIDKDGYLHTGDLGYLDGDLLYITGRKKEMIVLSNGKNINPADIENEISIKTNLIKEIAIIENNSVLTAIVYPDFQKIFDNKISNIKETIKYDVIDAYNKEAADYKKVLDVIIVNEELPKTRIGKIRRFMLKDFISNENETTEIIDEPDFDEYKVIKNYLSDLKNKKISPVAHIEIDLGLDSLDMVEFLHFIETRYSITDNEIVMRNPIVKDLAKYIRENKGDENNSNVNWSKILSQDTNTKIPKSNIFSKILKIFLAIIFNSYFKLKIKGLEKISDKTCIYVGNHQSYLDALMFMYAIKSEVANNTYSIAKVAHFDSKLKKFLANNANIVIVDLNKDVSGVLKVSAKILRSGKNILIFPEGTRTRDGKLGSFKKAFAILAKELNVDIQPFIISGAYDLFPANKKIPKTGNLEIEFLNRINNSELDLSYDEIVEKVRNIFVEKIK